MSRSKAEARRRRKRESCRRERRNRYRNRVMQWDDQPDPMFRAHRVEYEFDERRRVTNTGGIGAIHCLVRSLGLPEALNRSLGLLKYHVPYFESDHVLNIAYNVLCGGQCLEDLEDRRQDEAYVMTLGAERVPDPTTAGDFCRRFDSAAIRALMNSIQSIRKKVWSLQGPEFFREAIIDIDGTIVPTEGECKQGMDVSYDGRWGYHPLLVSLANTQEPLFLFNRSGNQTSNSGAAHWLDRAIGACRDGGFRRVFLRGDTDFSQTEHLDRWDGQGVRFLFGFDAKKEMVQKAESLPPSAWCALKRSPVYEVRTSRRRRPMQVKERIVEWREFENIKLLHEDVAEFVHQPSRCRKPYRMIVVRKHLKVLKGQLELYRKYRYFFYITNSKGTPEEMVFKANDRGNQENLIDQLKNGVRALHAPVNTLLSNWAYMVMSSLAWSLKAWAGMLLDDQGRWKTRRREETQSVLTMEFRKFVRYLVAFPVQVLRRGRRIIFRLLSWNPHQGTFLRLLDRLEHPLRC